MKTENRASKIRKDVHAVEIVEALILRRETGKTPNCIELQIRKPNFIFAENRERNRTETANRNSHQNRTLQVFWYKSRKTDLKNGQNRKTENPNALRS